MLATMTRSLTPNSPTGLVLLGTLITLILVNPFLGVLALLVTAVLSQARKNHGVLEATGIPVVKPTLFRGSEPNLHKTILHFEDIDRFKKFGGVWGSYVGQSPQVYIADPEIIRLVFVKDFVYFGDAQKLDMGSPMLNEILNFQPGEKWKTLRSSLSPLFTTLKMKQMSEVIASSAVEFMDDLKSECDGNGRLKIDCRKRLSTWLINMFTRATLGIQMEDAKNPDNKFAQAFREMMGENQEYNLLYSLSLSFPFLAKFAPTFNNEPTKLIESTFRQVMESRRKSGIKNGKDFLEVLCDLWERVPTKEFQDLGITETTVVGQGLSLFLGGYDTTATTLSHLLFYMVEYPEVQEKMHLELMAAFARRGGDDTIDHELIKDSEIPYILACINESLRLAPPLVRPERICTKDWNFKGISIKKGTIMMLASWAANRNPQVFPDEPEKFKPQRFLPENKAKMDPYGFTSFGFGPRNCVGMRFAYENLKIFMCNLVKNFRVEKRSDTCLKYKPGSMLLVGFSPLYVDLVGRK